MADASSSHIEAPAIKATIPEGVPSPPMMNEDGLASPQSPPSGTAMLTQNNPPHNPELTETPDTPDKASTPKGKKGDMTPRDGKEGESPETGGEDKTGNVKSPLRAGQAYRWVVVRQKDPAKLKEREERVRIARERKDAERKRKLEELHEAQRRAHEFREKQQQDRRNKLMAMRKREMEHRHLVDERRRKMIDEENERRQALIRKSMERDNQLERRNKRSFSGFGGSCLTLSSEKRESRGRGQTKASPSSRLSASTSQLAPPSVSKSRPVKDKATTIQEAKGVGGSQVDIRPKMSPLRTAASAAPGIQRTPPLSRRARSSHSDHTMSSSDGSPIRKPRPHSIAGRFPSYASHTVSSQARLGRSEEKKDTVSSLSNKSRSKSADTSLRRSQVDIQKTINRLSAPKLKPQVREAKSTPPKAQPSPGKQTAPRMQTVMPMMVPREKPQRPTTAVAAKGVTPTKGPLKAVHNINVPNNIKKEHPPKIPSPKEGSPAKEKAKTPTSEKAKTPTFEKARTPTSEKAKLPTTEKARTPEKGKPPKAATPKAAPPKAATPKAATPTPKEGPPATKPPSPVPKPPSPAPAREEKEMSPTKDTPTKAEIRAEENRSKIAENRRLAREKAEREAEEERLRQEELQRQEEERIAREEEEERRREEEELRMAAEARRAEEERLRRAIEEEENRRRDEQERLEAERVAKEEAEQKAKEDAERRERERIDRMRREEEERSERKKRLEMIMKRVKTDSPDHSPKNESPSPSRATVSPPGGSPDEDRTVEEGIAERRTPSPAIEPAATEAADAATPPPTTTAAEPATDTTAVAKEDGSGPSSPTTTEAPVLQAAATTATSVTEEVSVLRAPSPEDDSAPKFKSPLLQKMLGNKAGSNFPKAENGESQSPSEPAKPFLEDKSPEEESKPLPVMELAKEGKDEPSEDLVEMEPVQEISAVAELKPTEEKKEEVTPAELAPAEKVIPEDLAEETQPAETTERDETEGLKEETTRVDDVEVVKAKEDEQKVLLVQAEMKTIEEPKSAEEEVKPSEESKMEDISHDASDIEYAMNPTEEKDIRDEMKSVGEKVTKSAKDVTFAEDKVANVFAEDDRPEQDIRIEDVATKQIEDIKFKDDVMSDKVSDMDEELKIKEEMKGAEADKPVEEMKAPEEKITEFTERIVGGDRVVDVEEITIETREPEAVIQPLGLPDVKHDERQAVVDLEVPGTEPNLATNPFIVHTPEAEPDTDDMKNGFHDDYTADSSSTADTVTTVTTVTKTTVTTQDDGGSPIEKVEVQKEVRQDFGIGTALQNSDEEEHDVSSEDVAEASTTDSSPRSVVEVNNKRHDDDDSDEEEDRSNGYVEETGQGTSQPDLMAQSLLGMSDSMSESTLMAGSMTDSLMTGSMMTDPMDGSTMMSSMMADSLMGPGMMSDSMTGSAVMADSMSSSTMMTDSLLGPGLTESAVESTVESNGASTSDQNGKSVNGVTHEYMDVDGPGVVDTSLAAGTFQTTTSTLPFGDPFNPAAFESLPPGAFQANNPFGNPFDDFDGFDCMPLKPSQASSAVTMESSQQGAGRYDELIHLDNQPAAKDSLVGLDADLINSNNMDGTGPNTTPLLGFEDNATTTTKLKQDSLKKEIMSS